MTDLATALEQRLLQGYQKQLALYDHALAIVKVNGQDWAQALTAILEKVTLLDAAMAGDKTAWRESAGAAGSELSALLDQVAERIAALADRIHRDVADLQGRQEKLLPEIDEMIQQRRMLEAYGTYGDRSFHVA